MLLGINSYPKISYSNPLYQLKNGKTSMLLKSSAAGDSFSFTGRSPASAYDNVFEYLAADVIAGKPKKYGVDGSMLSANNIKAALENLEEENIYLPYSKTSADKIKWKSYIPQDIRVGSVEKINIARDARMNQWRKFLQHPDMLDDLGNGYNPDLVKRIQNNKALKLVIWNAIVSELKENNRHIPVPFDDKALLETIEGFEEIKPKDRAVRCAAPSFLEMYTHRLRDNLLMDMGLSDDDEVWVKIPSIKHDKDNKYKNIAALEILSCKNWCTRSSVDKAEDALLDGDFHIYLMRDKFNLWAPRVGMTSARGKLDQIQGVENDNIVPLAFVDKIKAYIEENDIKCHSKVIDEGPKARVGIMISDKLNEIDPITKKSFAKSIKERDSFAMFKHLGVDVKIMPDGGLSIDGYRPAYLIDSQKGISVPYSMFGINEDDLLRDVREINGNLILSNSKNKLYTSTITKFPPCLESVIGRVVCNSNQFAQYGEDITRVLGDRPSRYTVHNIN